MRIRIHLLVLSLIAVTSYSVSAQTPGLQWAHGFGSYAFEYGNSVLPDVLGNVVVAGNFSGTTDFDPGPGTASFTAVGADDIFFAAYSIDGTFMFAQHISSTGIARIGGLTSDSTGNIYVTGYFSQTADFFPASGNDTITATGLIDAFFAKYDPTGNLIWVKTLYATNTVYGRKIDLASDGRILIIGELRDFADVDPDTSTAFLASQGSTDVFLACYDSSGNYNWAFSLGDFSTEMATSVKFGDNGLVYVTGNFSGFVDFNPGPVNSYLMSSGASDGFFACYDMTGALVFAAKIGGPGFEQVNDLAQDSQGNLVITGVFNANADFDPDTAVVTAAVIGDLDIFFAKYSSTGDFIFVKSIGSIGIDEVESVDVDADNNIYIAGTLPDTADLDPGTGTVMANGAGAEDAFFASFDSSGIYKMSVHLASIGTDKSGDLALDDSGNILYTGGFSDTIDFNTSVGIYPLQATVNSDLFIARYSSCLPDTTVITYFTCDSILFNGQMYSSPGDYLFPAFPALGCDTVVHLHLEPAAPDTTLSISISSGMLTSNAADSGMTYQWVNCSNGFLPIAGADSISFTPGSNGSYAVILEINGCVDTSECGLLNVGLYENISQQIRVFPNPVTDQFSIRLNGHFLPGTIVKIYDAYGQLVQSGIPVINNVVSGNLRGYNAGVYFVEINDGRNSAIKRIVKIDPVK